MGQNFNRNRFISLYLCFAIFCEKFLNSKWPLFLMRQNFFENWDGYSAEIPCGSKILSKSLYLTQISQDISIFVFCNFLRKIFKFIMAAIFDETKLF